MSRGGGAFGLVMQPPEKYKRKVKKMTEINKANGLDASWAGQTFSNNGVKLSDLKESNKLLFDFFALIFVQVSLIKSVAFKINFFERR